MKNENAQSLGRLNRGRKKTMSKAGIAQRRKAAKISARARKGKPRNQPRDLKGDEAIDAAEQGQVTLHKYADPIEPARDDISVDEAREVAKEDPSLIYGTTNTTGDESVPITDPDFEARKHLLA